MVGIYGLFYLVATVMHIIALFLSYGMWSLLIDGALPAY